MSVCGVLSTGCKQHQLSSTIDRRHQLTSDTINYRHHLPSTPSTIVRYHQPWTTVDHRHQPSSIIIQNRPQTEFHINERSNERMNKVHSYTEYVQLDRCLYSLVHVYTLNNYTVTKKRTYTKASVQIRTCARTEHTDTEVSGYKMHICTRVHSSRQAEISFIRVVFLLFVFVN